MEKEKIQEKNIEGLQNGMNNLYKHIENIRNRFGLNVIVAINKYNTDSHEEIEFIQENLRKHDVLSSLVEGWEKGGDGAIDIANKLVDLAENQTDFKYIYDLQDDIKTKIEKVAREIYGATGVDFSEDALKQIDKIENLGYGKLPICIAKTQYSFSDDSKNLECKNPFKISIREVNLKAGAGFIVAVSGKIMTMPGLPKIPAAEDIDIDKDGNVVGIF